MRSFLFLLLAALVLVFLVLSVFPALNWGVPTRVESSYQDHRVRCLNCPHASPTYRSYRQPQPKSR
jgi:hypothetical protein